MLCACRARGVRIAAYRIDAASSLQYPGMRPKPGDLSVCFGCGEVLQFTKRLRVAKMTAAELAALREDEAAPLRATQALIRRFLAAQGARHE